MNTIAAAHEINELWLECLVDAGYEIVPENCPGDHRVAMVIENHLNKEFSNEEVAEIIEKHFADTAKTEPKLEDK